MNDSLLVGNYVLAESFIKISYAIEELYHKLYKLEIKGLKNSEEYHKTLDYLDMALEYEEGLYKESQLNALKCRDVIHLIIHGYLNGKMLNDFESIVARRYENASLRRVINNLNYLMMSDYAGMHEISMDDLFEIKDNGGVDYTFYTNSLNNTLTLDFVSNVLTILQDKIDNTKDVRLKNKLIRDKYFISFINPKNEKDLVDNSFVPCNYIIDNSRVISSLIGVMESDYQDLKEDFVMKKARKLLYKTLLKNSNLSINSEELLLRECLFRALLVMMDKDSFIEIEDEITSKKSSNSTKMMFNNCLMNHEKDKDKQITLKLW